MILLNPVTPTIDVIENINSYSSLLQIIILTSELTHAFHINKVMVQRALIIDEWNTKQNSMKHVQQYAKKTSLWWKLYQTAKRSSLQISHYQVTIIWRYRSISYLTNTASWSSGTSFLGDFISWAAPTPVQFVWLPLHTLKESGNSSCPNGMQLVSETWLDCIMSVTVYLKKLCFKE